MAIIKFDYIKKYALAYVRSKMFITRIKKFSLVLCFVLLFSSINGCSLLGEAFEDITPSQAPLANQTQAPDKTDITTPTPTSTSTPTPTTTPSGFVQVSEDKMFPDSVAYGDPLIGATPDGKYIYQVDDNRVCKLNAEDYSVVERLTINYPFIPNYVDCCYVNDDLEECIVISGRGADDKYYTIVYNLTKDLPIYTFDNNSHFSFYVQNGYPQLYGWHDYVTSMTFFRVDEPFAFVNNQSINYSFYRLNEQYILAHKSILPEVYSEITSEFDYTEQGSENIFTLFDVRKMSFVATSTISFDYFASLRYIPCMEGNTVQLVFSDYEGEDLQVFQWEYESKPEDRVFVADVLVIDNCPESVFTDKVYPEGDFSEIIELMPGDCIASLADLREKADALQEKYDVEIHISNECRMYCGGYNCTPENNRDIVSDALDKLDYELGKYPKGFFSQFKAHDYYKQGVCFYLAGALYGEGDDYSLDKAGGFRSEGYNKIIIFVDINDSMYSNTYHHELSHAIESILDYDERVDEDTWLSLSSDEITSDPYTYSYKDWGNSEYYNHILQWDDDYSDDCFIDSYSLTYPTEDRARIFEHAMSDDSWVNFEDFPLLEEKLRYWSDIIRAGMDSSDWPEFTYWERIFED